MAHVIERLLDPKVVSILKVISKDKKSLFHLSKISHDSQVPMGSTHRIVGKLCSLGLIDIIHIEKTKLYKIASNSQTEDVLQWI